MYNVAIVGKFGSGKTSLANALTKFAGYTQVANADALKQLAYKAYGDVDKAAMYEVVNTDGTKRDVSGREILQGLGQIVKDFDRDFWLKSMYRDMSEKVGPFVCDDTRFQFEADSLREHNFIIVKLYVPPEVRLARYNDMYGRNPTESELNHPSETELDNIEYDLLLSGTETVTDLVDQIMDHMQWRYETQEDAQ